MAKLKFYKTSGREGRGSMLALRVERDSLPGEYPLRLELVDGIFWIGEERSQLIILRNRLRVLW